MNTLKERLSDMGNVETKRSRCPTWILKLKEKAIEKTGKQQESIGRGPRVSRNAGGRARDSESSSTRLVQRLSRETRPETLNGDTLWHRRKSKIRTASGKEAQDAREGAAGRLTTDFQNTSSLTLTHSNTIASGFRETGTAILEFQM